MLKNAAMSDKSQESVFSVTVSDFLLNTDLHALIVAYGNPCFVLFFPKTLSSLSWWILLLSCLAFFKEIESFLPFENYAPTKCNGSQFRKKEECKIWSWQVSEKRKVIFHLLSIICKSTYIICYQFGLSHSSGKIIFSTPSNTYQCSIEGSEIVMQRLPVILRATGTMNKQQIIIFKRSFSTIELCYLTSKHIQDIIAKNARWHSKQKLAVKGVLWWLFSVTCHLVLSAMNCTILQDILCFLVSDSEMYLKIEWNKVSLNLLQNYI